uniref:TNFR-Cys domain-containing protein n=1 Tax=Echeneis naucrates TaxID=173247 RepID=A0A665U096_ECHNA
MFPGQNIIYCTFNLCVQLICKAHEQYYYHLPSNSSVCLTSFSGKYVKADCDGSQQTQCAECGKGLYTATKNHLNQCRVCSKCICTATQNTVCTCEEGFFCLNEQCDHCKPVTQCREGEGVKIRGRGPIYERNGCLFLDAFRSCPSDTNRTSDTVCVRHVSMLTLNVTVKAKGGH